MSGTTVDHGSHFGAKPSRFHDIFHSSETDKILTMHTSTSMDVRAHPYVLNSC